MCDIGKIKHVTNEVAPQKAQDIFRRVRTMIPVEKVIDLRPKVKVRVKRSHEDRL